MNRIILATGIGLTVTVALVRIARGNPRPPKEDGKISGIVTSDTGAVLQGAVVDLSGLKTDTDTTDTSGYFEFTGLKYGSYNLSASKDGYTSSSTIPVSVPNNTPVTKNIQLLHIDVADFIIYGDGSMYSAVDKNGNTKVSSTNKPNTALKSLIALLPASGLQTILFSGTFNWNPSTDNITVELPRAYTSLNFGSAQMKMLSNTCFLHVTGANFGLTANPWSSPSPSYFNGNRSGVGYSNRRNIELSGVAGFTIDGVRMFHTPWHALGLSGGCHDGMIKNAEFSDHVYAHASPAWDECLDGITVAGSCYGVTITKSRFHDCKPRVGFENPAGGYLAYGGGIEFFPSSLGGINHCSVIDCDFWELGEFGIGHTRSQGMNPVGPVYVSDMVESNNRFGIAANGAPSGAKMGKEAIDVTWMMNSTLQDNIIDGAERYGLNIYTSETMPITMVGTKMIHNTIRNVGVCGINWGAATYFDVHQVLNNILRNLPRGLAIGSHATNTLVDGNDFTGCADEVYNGNSTTKWGTNKNRYGTDVTGSL